MPRQTRKNRRAPPSVPFLASHRQSIAHFQKGHKNPGTPIEIAFCTALYGGTHLLLPNDYHPMPAPLPTTTACFCYHNPTDRTPAHMESPNKCALAGFVQIHLPFNSNPH
ncbi:hypothetical protein Tcan_00708, partial [Toxocara canis]